MIAMTSFARNVKNRLALWAAAALFVLAPLAAQAGDQDTLTITVQPNAYYAIDIDTANVSLDLGTVDMGSSTQTVRPSTITIESTYATTDLMIQGFINSAGTPWTFDDNTASTEANKVALWATFTSVERSSAPTQGGGYFSGTVPGASASDVVDNTQRYVGTGGGSTDLFEADTEFGAKDMDALPPVPDPLGQAHLWLRLRLPSATTTNNEQNISITITATAPN